uniref:Uncharacterized protein n=1 Tax=Lygus hesperus TaxID=30085 RepID=A0A0K8SP47_LYGHE
MKMSPAVFAVLLVLSVSQVLGDDSSKFQHEEIMEVLSSVNKTVNKLYDLMSTQKERDIDFIEKKMDETYQQLRNKREAPTENPEAIDKIQNAFKSFQDGVKDFVKSASSSDLYKKVQEIGEDLQNKGKELGEKLQETINNARTKNSDEKKD